MKKLAALAGAGALLLSMAGPAFGMGWWWPSDDVTINNWMTSVKTKVYTKADSGDNSITGGMVCGGSITTGAAGATALVGNDVNTSIVPCDACNGDVNISNGFTQVRTKVKTKADSGDNYIGGMFVSGGTIRTGAAGATSVVEQYVNYSQVGL